MAGAAKARQAKERKAKLDEGKKISDKSSSDKTDSRSSGTPPSYLSSPTRLDGNRDPETRSRTGSNASRTSATGPSPPQAAFIGVMAQDQNKNVTDMGYNASMLRNGFAPSSALPVRPAANKTGREVAVKLNTWHVTDFPTKPVYQWDVLIGQGQEKRGLIMALWHSKSVKAALGSQGWLFDGKNLAWSLTKPKEEIRVLVDLDKDEDKPTRKDKKTGEDKPDVHRVVIKFTRVVPFDTLRAYLDRKAQFDKSIYDSINFLDHLLREGPSQKYTTIKRSFFPPGQQRTPLGSGIEALKGVYASFRMVHKGQGIPPTLSVTVDVANGTFWTETALMIAMKEVGGFRDLQTMTQTLKGSTNALKPLKRLRVHTRHIEKDVAKAKKSHSWVIESFIGKSAKEYTFTKTDKKTGIDRKITVLQHFKEEYNITLQFPDLPLVQMTKKNNLIPAELLWINDNQRYSAKLSDRQTMEMIKFAVTLPDVRYNNIENGIKMLNWAQDQYLSNYGLKISPTPTVVKARLLPNPKVVFANDKTDPRTTGRWDLKGKKFLEPHPEPLVSWGVAVMPGRFASSKEQVDNFIREFVRVFAAHGGKIKTTTPYIMQGDVDAGKAVASLFTGIGTKFQRQPQLMVFIVPDKNVPMYKNLKKSADCRYGVVSQVLQSAHVQKAQAQYCSNVCMKVNAKLGGITAKAVGYKGEKPWFTRPTMIIGADVSHGAPGTAVASIAAMTVSWDKACIRYAAAVETNGSRVEMITKQNIDGMLKPLVEKWRTMIGGGLWPEHVLYFRDGVSEGQYAHVIEQEVKDMKTMMAILNPKGTTKFTVLIASKRHHVRFFPEKGSGDKNNNPQPGTLVETGITHPFEYDFYLCAHSAIKGTARPVHYHVLLDEAKMGVEELQNMIYEASYQYVRSTTPVSLFPAVYYAHLAAERGGSHLDMKFGETVAQTTTTGSSSDVDVKALLPMPQSAFRGTMWYV